MWESWKQNTFCCGLESRKWGDNNDEGKRLQIEIQILMLAKDGAEEGRFLYEAEIMYEMNVESRKGPKGLEIPTQILNYSLVILKKFFKNHKMATQIVANGFFRQRRSHFAHVAHVASDGLQMSKWLMIEF